MATLTVTTVATTGWTPTATSAATRAVLAAAAETAPDSTSIIIPKNARVNGYQTTHPLLAQGGTLSVVNFDTIAHTVTADDNGPDGHPLFDTEIGPGSTVSIPAVSKLAAGDYPFHCFFHAQHMTGTLSIRGGTGGVHAVPPKFEQPLVVPKRLTTAHIRIPIKAADVRVLPHGPLTRMWTYGGTYPGPTIVRPAGKDTKVTFVNKLPKSAGSLTVHLHGDHHSSASDGQPTTHLIAHGHARTYDYPLTDGGHAERAASYWYHDHRMGRTGRNVWMGLQGMFFVKDGKASQLRLPEGRFDVPLLVSNRTFTSTNQLTRPFPKHMVMEPTGPEAPPDDATIGKQILVNGRFAPYLRVSTHRYRLRLVNGSNFTPYDFKLSDGRPLVQIATGNGLLPKPVVRQDILLGPAQRADVIVDFHRELGKKVLLESQPRTDTSAKNAIGTPNAAIMQFRVATDASSDKTRIPATLQAAPKLDVPSHVDKSWTVDVGGNKTTGSYWTINGKPFNPNRIDYRVAIGSTELWRLHNASPITHFIHIHEEQWRTISRDGHRPPPWERGLEDTWKLDPGETVTVAAKFTDHLGVFMIHCHMLDHEDHGLMTQYKVVRRSSATAAARVANTEPVSSTRAASTAPTTQAGGFMGWRYALLQPFAPGPAAKLPSSRRWMCSPDGKDA